jgi:hypothetical protein
LNVTLPNVAEANCPTGPESKSMIVGARKTGSEGA